MEVELEDRVVCVDPESISKVQAVWRGYSTRDRLLLIQREYLDIVREIEGNDSTQVNFSSTPLGVPTFTSKKRHVTNVPKGFSKQTTEGLKIAPEDDTARGGVTTGHDDVSSRSTGQGTNNKEIGSAQKSYCPGGQSANSTRSDDREGRGASAAQRVTSGGDHVIEKTVELRVPSNRGNNNSEHSDFVTCSESSLPTDKKETKDSRVGFETVATGRTTKPSEGAVVNGHIVTEVTQESLVSEPDDVMRGLNGRVTMETERELVNNLDGEKRGVEEEDEFINMLNEKKDEVSADELESMRGHVAMELLWVQQAISSRKQYLRLKDQMRETVVTS